MLGNGFDLANKLPTTYKDFLEFCKHLSYIFEDEDLNAFDNEYDKKYLSKCSLNYHIKQILNNQFHLKSASGNTWRVESDYLNELYDCVHNNTFYAYFQFCLQEKKLKGENWIDFESEIAVVIHELERLIQYKSGTSSDKSPIKILEMYDRFKEKEFDKSDYNENLIYESHKEMSSKRTITQIEIEEIYKLINDLLSDLNKLTHALELYLSAIVSHLKPSLITDFENQSFTHIISFNYTKTFEDYYPGMLSDEHDFCYVHGVANKDSSVDTCNLVLGIDEYLSDDRKNIDLVFLAFKKYYQRIFKQTDNKYSSWIELITEESDDCNGKSVRIEEYELHIFGHSLDVTDKDILRKFILNDNVQTKIYYYRTESNDKRDFSSKIKNLIKIIGQDELIARTGGGSKNTIEFIPQNI